MRATEHAEPGGVTWTTGRSPLAMIHEQVEARLLQIESLGPVHVGDRSTTSSSFQSMALTSGP